MNSRDDIECLYDDYYETTDRYGNSLFFVCKTASSRWNCLALGKHALKILIVRSINAHVC